jgi:hypothetical protein
MQAALSLRQLGPFSGRGHFDDGGEGSAMLPLVLEDAAAAARAVDALEAALKVQAAARAQFEHEERRRAVQTAAAAADRREEDAKRRDEEQAQRRMVSEYVRECVRA